MKAVPHLSIETLLYHYGAETVPEGDRWRKMRCILPDHDDRHPSASVNVDAGKFVCYACDFKGDGYDLIQRIEGCDFRASLGFAASIPDARCEEVSPLDDDRGAWLPRKPGHSPRAGTFSPDWLGIGA